MIPLKIKLIRVQNIVLMKVLQMDSSLRGNGTLFKYGGLTLLSEGSPVLYSEFIYIRGHNLTKDNDIVLRFCRTECDAKDYILKIKKLVEEFNRTKSQKQVDDEVESFIIE